MVAAGAVSCPVTLAWGLQRTSGASACPLRRSRWAYWRIGSVFAFAPFIGTLGAFA
jgi:hypothetical protein